MNSLPPPTALSVSRETIGSLLSEYLSTRFLGAKPATLAVIERQLQVFLSYAALPGTASVPAGLHPSTLAFFPVWLQSADFGHGGQRTPATISRYVMVARRFLRWLYTTERTPRDLSLQLPTIRVPHSHPPQIFSYAEYRQLVEAATGQNSRFRWLLILSWHTGMSLVDCCYLRWASIDFTAQPILLKTNRIKLAGRGEGIFEVPILVGTEIHEALLVLWEQRQPLGNINDQYVSPAAYQYYQYGFGHIRQDTRRFIRKVLGAQCGRTFKHLRNTFISSLANSGMNLALACKMSGHKSPEIFTHYLKPDPKALAAGLASAFDYAMNQTPPKIKYDRSRS